MKTISFPSRAVVLFFLWGQFSDATFPCFYLNYLPWIGSYCPVTWSQEQIYAGDGLGSYFVMSLDGTAVAFSTDDRTVRIMKKSMVGTSWDQVGNDIHLSSADSITGLELDADGTSLAIESSSRSTSRVVTDLGYIYKFSHDGALCRATLGLFFCASSDWEKEGSFLDVYQMSFSASGNRIAIAASTTDEVKVYTRRGRRPSTWEQVGTTITAGDHASTVAPSVYLDASGTTVMVVQTSEAQLFQLVGAGCSGSTSPSSCEFEKHGSKLTSDSGSFLILPARENALESVVALELMGSSSITSTFQRLSCPTINILDECTWQEDLIFEEVINTTGKIIFPNVDGTAVMARDLGISNEWQAFQTQVFLGWNPVGGDDDNNVYEFAGSFNPFHNIMSPSGDSFVSMMGGDVYIVSLS